MRRLSRRLPRWSLDLASSQRGAALIEFAMVLPFLIALFAGGFQLNDATSAYRKVTSATRTVADLTSQFTKVNNTDVETILNAGQQVIAPYPASRARMTVSRIDVDSTGSATVIWSQGRNTAGLTRGAAFSLPAELKQPDTSLIVAQIIYSYRPIFYGTLLGTIPLTDTLFMNPRSSPTVEYVS